MRTIPVLRFAQGVTMSRPPAPAGCRILRALDDATLHLDRDLVVTCADGKHPPDDPHTLGEAYDVRTRDLDVERIVELHAYLMGTLGPLFTVLYEVPKAPTEPALVAIATVSMVATADHIHVQRKRGTSYPPAGV